MSQEVEPAPKPEPKEVKLRRYGLYRTIPGFDLVQGQELLTVGKQAFVFLGLVDEAPRMYLDFDETGNIKGRFDWYGRDGDLDGQVQDGTEYQRRSRSLTHLRYSRNARKPVPMSRLRLRDMPFPLPPSKPTPASISEEKSAKQEEMQVSPTVARELLSIVRWHNSRMREKGASHWSMTNLPTLTNVLLRELNDSQESKSENSFPVRRIHNFLHLLEKGEPSSPTYFGDNDLLEAGHPWKSAGPTVFFSVKSISHHAESVELRYALIHDAAFKATPKKKIPSFSGGADIGTGKRVNVDGPGIRAAVQKGAVVDEMGRLRCPPMTPGAMQFTNWKLEGCGNPRKVTRKKIQLTVDELAEFTAANGQIVSSADIAEYMAQATGQTVGATKNIRERRQISEKLKKTKLKKGPKTAGLSQLVEKSGREQVRISFADGEKPQSGLAVPRPGQTLAVNLDEILDEDGFLTEDGAARIVEWVDRAISDPGRSGAISSMMTISHSRRSPREPEMPPLTGKAQDLADLAGGDFNKFMDLLFNEEIVIFDFETTGIGLDGNMPVEVAALRVRGGQVLERKHFFMNPGTPLGEWAASNLKGPDGNPLTDKWLARQRSVASGIRELTDFIGDSIVVAHNAPFDTEILTRTARQSGIDFTPAGSLDTLVLARQMMSRDEMPRGKFDLGALAEFSGVEMKSWHTAWSDTESLIGILDGLRRRGREKPVKPEVLDAAWQAARLQKESEEFARKTKDYKESNLLVLDVLDIFDDAGLGSTEERQAAMQAVLDIAGSDGVPHVISLSDGKVITVNEGVEAIASSVDRSSSPARARIHDAKTRLNAAFSQLESKDNMNLNSFSPAQLNIMMSELKKVPGFEWIDPNDPDHLFLALDQGARNIYRLAESATPEERAKWRRWYEAANAYAIDLARERGISVETSAAVIAVLSPTQDWNANIALGDHVIKLLFDPDFRVDNDLAKLTADQLLSSLNSKKSTARRELPKKQKELSQLRADLLELESAGASASEIAKKRERIKSLENQIRVREKVLTLQPPKQEDLAGKKLSDFDLDTQAQIIQLHAKFRGASYMGQPPIQGKNDGIRSYSMDVDEAGGYQLDFMTDKARVQSIGQYKKAIRILQADKSGKANLNVISKELGKGSKVRSFYNNILNPNDARYLDVTSDTHHFGAATIVPVSASHEILDVIFKPSSAGTGASSAYPLFRAMTILAASRWNAENGDDVAPRAMQSISWEMIRKLIPTKFPDPKNPERETRDTSLKSHITDTFAQIARLSSGPDPKRPDLADRQIELLDELSRALQGVPRSKDNAERRAALEAFRQKYDLPEIRDQDRMKMPIKVDKDGRRYTIDKETGERVYIDAAGDEVGDSPFDLTDIAPSGFLYRGQASDRSYEGLPDSSLVYYTGNSGYASRYGDTIETLEKYPVNPLDIRSEMDRSDIRQAIESITSSLLVDELTGDQRRAYMAAMADLTSALAAEDSEQAAARQMAALGLVLNVLREPDNPLRPGTGQRAVLDMIGRDALIDREEDIDGRPNYSVAIRPVKKKPKKGKKSDHPGSSFKGLLGPRIGHRHQIRGKMLS